MILGKGGPGHLVAQVRSRRKKSGARQHLLQEHKIWRLNDASPPVATRGQAKYMGKMIWVGVGACPEPQSLSRCNARVCGVPAKLRVVKEGCKLELEGKANVDRSRSLCR